MFTKTLVVLAAALSAVAAAPTNTNATRTTATYASKTLTLTGVTHSVVAGRAGLRFDPENIVAAVGDVVEFHFLPRNHSVVESSFGQPCQPKDASPSTFSSGFFFVPEGQPQSSEVFQVVVKDDKPIWFYCAQTTGNHCQAGMTGVVNQKFDSAFTLAKHKELAAQRTAPSEILPYIQGGARIANPNPLGGF